MRAHRWVWFVVLSACGDDSGSSAEGETGFIDEDIPAGNCGETDNAPCESSDGGVPDPPCDASDDCWGGMICAAVFDGDIGSFVCRSSCIDDRDESQWCIDDVGCCNPDATCSDRGYCIPADTTTGDTTGGDTTGSDDSSTGESGSSDDAGTSTDGSTGGAALPDERPDPR
jgi:hypothetical protein